MDMPTFHGIFYTLQICPLCSGTGKQRDPVTRIAFDCYLCGGKGTLHPAVKFRS